MARTLSEVINEHADNLIKKWAERNKNNLWLGAKSREEVKQEIVAELKWAYELAKRKYKPED